MNKYLQCHRVLCRSWILFFIFKKNKITRVKTKSNFQIMISLNQWKNVFRSVWPCALLPSGDCDNRQSEVEEFLTLLYRVCVYFLPHYTFEYGYVVILKIFFFYLLFLVAKTLACNRAGFFWISKVISVHLL